MHKLIQRASLFAAILLVFSPQTNVYAQDTGGTKFEGTITLEITVPQMGDQKINALINLKGQQMMMNIDMGAMGSMETFMDKSKRTVTSFSTAQKTGMQVDLPAADAKPTGDTTVTATGKTQTINGYNAQQFTANSAAGPMEIWATPDLPQSWRDALLDYGKNNPQGGGTGIYNALATKGLAPIRTIQSTSAGAVTIDVIKVEPKPLADAIFVVPSDIKIKHMTMDEVKQMQGGGKAH
jgi:hypothetical protein